MAARFDPYQAWLGIASVARPPNHYELLGLPAFESDAGRISTAFERQKVRVSQMATGPQTALAEQVLQQLSSARQTLITPGAKQAYDAQLRATAGSLASHPPRRDAADALLPPMAVPGPRPQPPTVPMATLISPPGSAPALRPPPPPIAAPARPPVATPVYPHGPALAPGGAPQAQGAAVLPSVSTAPSTVSAYLHRPKRRRSSFAPAAIGLAVAAILATAAAVYIQSDRQGPLAQGPGAPTDQPKRAPETETHTSDAAHPDVGTSQRRSHGERGSRRSRRAVDGGRRPAIAAVARMSSSDPSPGSGDPLMASDVSADSDNPKDSDSMPDMDDGMSNAADAAGDSAQAVTAGQRDPPNPQIEASVKRNLAAARAALARRDVAAAEEQLNLAMLDVETRELEAEIDRALLLSAHVADFWQAVGKSLAGLEVAEELDLDGQVVIVVESENRSLVVRGGGRNRTYTLEKLPVPLALLLAQRSLPRDDPKSKAALGAFHAVDARGDVAQARRLWQEAAGQGFDAASLLLELDSRSE
ncbi:MAG: hypothetical protein WD847_12025 [Pirellulales bacterium]